METLELVCRDAFLNLQVTPSYSVFADTDIITRSVRVENCGEQHLKLEKAYSTCLDMDNAGGKLGERAPYSKRRAPFRKAES